MRVIALGFVNESTVELLSRLVEKFDIVECESYYDTPNSVTQKFPASSHHYVEIHKGNYGIDWNDIIPLDGQLIDEMEHCEAVVLRMFDRANLWLPMSYEERKQLYLKHLRYWNHVITQKKMQVCLITGVPHGMFDYVCYALCKHHGVPVFMLSCPSLVMHTVFMSDSWQEPAPTLEQEYARLKSLHGDSFHQTISLSQKYENILKAQADLKIDPIPYYMAPKLIDNLLEKPPSMIGPVLNKLRKIFKPSRWSLYRAGEIADRLYSGRKIRSAIRDMATFYRDNAKPLNPGRRYVYVPLHLQPECTTSPMAASYTEQLLIVQLLASILPDDVLIYVKEHPVQMQYGIVNRTMQFYRELVDIPSVRLMSLEENTFRLIDNSVAVAAATGSAGWEGIFRGKPYLMFGHHVYQYAPGVYPIRSTADCRSAVESIFTLGLKPSVDDLRLFLKAFENTAINADAVEYRIAVSPLSREENIGNLFDAFSKAIQSL